MEKILEGKSVVAKMSEAVTQKVEAFKSKGIEPTIIIIRVGNRPDDVSYEKSIVKNCEKLGIKAIHDTIPEDVSQKELLEHIEKANNDSAIHGVMLFRPLPKHINQDDVQNAINPLKDIDCITKINLSKVFDDTADFYPCTSQAVVTLLKHYQVPLQGADVVIVGRSLVVGKPLAMLLLRENATVTVCHSRTKELEKFTKSADVVVAAIGRAKTLNEKHFTENSIVADVGINYDPEEKKIVGDVDFASVEGKVKAITPTLGGIGLVTTMTLLSNVVDACEKMNPSK